jgi:hypothetical protein
LLRLHDARGYDELVSLSTEIVDDGIKLRVIDLEALIDIKRSTGRARDALVLPLLIAIRDRET